MSSLSTRSDISGYKSQLDEFLSRKYVDQSLLLGFTAVLQSKFSNWIDKDIESYYEQLLVTQNGQPNPVSFELIQLFETIWGQFLYPIIKFYQFQHAELYNSLIATLKTEKPAFKAVEMRKLNELFSKYIKSAIDFYFNLLQKIMKKYTVLLIPDNWLSDINISMTEDGLKSTNPDFDANLTYIVYHCLVGLGNLARHSTQIHLNYAQPCKSVAEYYKCMKQQKTTNEEAMVKYSTAMHYYALCVGLLPTLNEPYNGQGVIYNNLKLKFNATLLFLRSQFTRIPGYPIGKHNLDTIFTKPWLEAAFHATAQKKPTDLGKKDFEIMMLKIIKHYHYRDPRLSSFNVEKAQHDLLNYLFPSSQSGFAQHGDDVQNQLTVLICFYTILQTDSRPAPFKQFRLFVVSYFSRYLQSVENLDENGVSGALKNLRLILAFVRKNRNMCAFAESLVGALNSLTARFDDIIGAKVFETGAETPIRSYYFEEDVHFKDFLPIGYQFKDFDDSFLFSSGNVNLLFGSDFYTRKKGIPEFLDNEAAQRIMKEAELDGGDESGRLKAVKVECERYENELRLQAVSVMALKIFGSQILADAEKQEFVLVKVDVPETQVEKKPIKAKSTQMPNGHAKIVLKKQNQVKPAEPAKAGKKPTLKQTKPSKKVAETSHVKPTQTAAKGIPSSLEEIELIILGHASGFDKHDSSVVSESQIARTSSSVVDGSQPHKDPHEPVMVQKVKIAKRKAVEPQVVATQLSDKSDSQHVQSNIHSSPNIQSTDQSAQRIVSSSQPSELLSSLQVLQPLQPMDGMQPNGAQPVNQMSSFYPQFPSSMPMFPQQNFGYPMQGQMPQNIQMGQPQMAQMPQMGQMGQMGQVGQMGPMGQMLSYVQMSMPQVPNNNLPYEVYAQPVPGINFQNQMLGMWNGYNLQGSNGAYNLQGNNGTNGQSYNGHNGQNGNSHPPATSTSFAESPATSQSSQVQVHLQSQPNSQQGYFASQHQY